MVEPAASPRARRRWSAWTLAGLALLLGACQRERTEDAVWAPSAPSATAHAALPDELTSTSRKLALEMQRVNQHLNPPLDPPAKLEARTCSDAELPAARSSEPARALVLSFADRRYDRRDLLPTAVTGALETDPLAELRQYFDAPEGLLSNALAWRLKSAEAGRQARERLAAVRETAFGGVFHITAFAEPRLIYRPRDNRRVWVPGLVRAWFAIHDLDTGAALCQTELHVQNDVSEVSLRWRLRLDNRDRLTRALGSELRAQAERELPRLSAALRMPERAVESATDGLAASL